MRDLTTDVHGDAIVPSSSDEDPTEPSSAAMGETLPQPGTTTSAETDGTNNDDRSPADRRQRVLVRAVAAKAVELGSLSTRRRRLLAATLRSDHDDPVRLTVDVMTAPRAALAPLRALLELAAAEPMEAAVRATTMERPQLRALWLVMAELGMAPAKSMPPSGAKAALAVAQAAHGMSDKDRDDIHAAIAAASRS